MRDKNYWKDFYKNNNQNKNCSDFCKFILEYFKSNKDIFNVLDAGCGNGRDSLVLCKKYKVTGVDNCGFKINYLNENIKFVIDNFIYMDKSQFDLIYSRFTFHSINNKEHEEFLETIKPNTYLSIEARSNKDITKKKYYGNTHYRNYIELNYLKELLIKKNFEILFIKEDKNFAKYKDENPICIRVICKKKI